MTIIQMCRICLDYDTLLYTMENMQLQKFYKKLTNKSFRIKNGTSSVCYLCHHLLSKCYMFIESAKKADAVLQQLYRSDIQITEQLIAKIRKPLLLTAFKKSPVTNVNVAVDLPEVPEVKCEDDNDPLSLDGTYDQQETIAINETESREIMDNTKIFGIKVDGLEAIDESSHDELSPISTVQSVNPEPDPDDDVTLDIIRMRKYNGAVQDTSNLCKAGEDNRDGLEAIDETSHDELSPISTVPSVNPEPDSDDDVTLDIIRMRKYNGAVQDTSNLCKAGEDNRDARVPKKSKPQEITKSPNNLEAELLSIEDIHSDKENQNGCDKMHVQTGLNKVNTEQISNKIIEKDRKKEKTFTCYYCGIKSHSKVDFLLHLRTHANEKRFPCNICDKRFHRRYDLSTHLRTHTGERPFECKFCDKNYTQKSSLWFHLKTHTGEKLIMCNYCGKQFTQKQDLLKHVRTHTGEKPFQCDYCSKKFTQKITLTEHIRLHTGEKPFKCGYCKEKFAQKKQLTNHVRVHTGEKLLMCNYCGRRFTDENKFDNHVIVHNGEMPFACNYCGHKFKFKNDLKSHLNTHIGPFECNKCGKSFTQKQFLQEHLTTHSNSKSKITCKYCDKIFGIKGLLKSHVCSLG